MIGVGATAGRYVALDLTIEQSYDKTALRQIAEPPGSIQTAIYYHFGAKEDIPVALRLRLHELARPFPGRLTPEAGPSGWATVLRELVDTTLANRKLLVLHQRNQTACPACISMGTRATTRTWTSNYTGSWATPRSLPATGSG